MCIRDSSLSDQNQDKDKYSLILANPPFKGSLDAESVSGDLLKVCKTKKTELLFLALFLRMLKIGGRCACIVPDGVLFGSSKAHKSIRKEIVENQRLEAVSYTHLYRHNEANGEDNRDGSEFNYSWNCGVEGSTRKTAVRRMREQQMRNAFLMLLLSQGTPMIYGGDEFANSQAGNNNVWCQDNPTGWTDWKNARRHTGLSSFVKEAIAFRKNHPILHMPKEMRGVDYMAKGFPDVSVHGERAWFLNRDNTSRLLGIMYCGAYAQKDDGTEDDFLYIGMNFHWEKRNIALPNLPDGMNWKKIADTSEMGEPWFREQEEPYKKSVKINPRTIVVLTARQEESEHASVAPLQNDNEA